MIETKRLLIRREEIGDAEELRKLLADPEARKFTGGAKDFSLKEMRDKIAEKQKEFSTDYFELKDNDKNCVLSVILKATGKYAGYCGFQYCKEMNEVEFLYGFLKEYWGLGIGTEAAKAVLDFGFSSTNMKEVFAAVNPANVASEKILQSIGMRFRKQFNWPEQGMVNQYSISRDEYNEL